MKIHKRGVTSQEPTNQTIVEEADGTFTVTLKGVTRSHFTYKRPRCPMRHIRRAIRRLIRRIRRNSRRIARIIVKSIVSGAFVAAGIIAGLTIAGLLLFFCGICLASCQESETEEEYRQAVIEHFSERGQTPPRWTRRGGE